MHRAASVCFLLRVSVVLVGAVQALEQPPSGTNGAGRNSIVLTPRLGFAPGTSVTVSGVVDEDGGELRVDQIGGKATHAGIVLRLEAFDEDDPKLWLDPTEVYALRGYEAGSFVGIPRQAYKEIGRPFRSRSYGFRWVFVYYEAEKRRPATGSPADHAGRRATFIGIAASQEGQPALEGDGWIGRVRDITAWPAHALGKEVEVEGIVSASPREGEFVLSETNWRLVRLEDQVGRSVMLVGVAMRRNGFCWLRYRGVDVHVENMEDMRGWSGAMVGRKIAVSGKLEKWELPLISMLIRGEDGVLAEQYVVRTPSCRPVAGAARHQEVP